MQRLFRSDDILQMGSRWKIARTDEEKIITKREQLLHKILNFSAVSDLKVLPELTKDLRDICCTSVQRLQRQGKLYSSMNHHPENVCMSAEK